MIARDITISKSLEAILPGAHSSSEPLNLVSIEANVEEGIGENTDNEPVF
jgi:hypothetical protein